MNIERARGLLQNLHTVIKILRHKDYKYLLKLIEQIDEALEFEPLEDLAWKMWCWK